VSCRPEIKQSDLAKLNGYWEIESVTLADGSEKEYKVSEIIDLFEVKGTSGVRKKVRPQFNGKYPETGDYQKIDLVFSNGKAYLKYTTDYSKWQEEVVAVSEEELVLKNKQDVEYHYKKHIPFSLK
jgi:hypothetical protein